jgi:hypothetical protein
LPVKKVNYVVDVLPDHRRRLFHGVDEGWRGDAA